MIAQDITWQTPLGRCAALRYGAPSSRVAVLMPGFTCNAADWPGPLLKGLVAEGFQVDALDWPDSGASDRVQGGSYGIRELTTAAQTYAEQHLGGKEIHWIGLSMGSLVAQELTRLEVPAASYSLIFTSSGSLSHGSAELGTLARLLGVRVDTTVEEATYALTALREELACRPKERDMAELRRRVASSVKRAWPYKRGPWRQLAAVTDYFTGGGTTLPSRLEVPTLIIHGTRDPLLPVAGARALAERWEGSRYVELPEVGHELILSRLDSVIEPLLEHLQSASILPQAI